MSGGKQQFWYDEGSDSLQSQLLRLETDRLPSISPPPAPRTRVRMDPPPNRRSNSATRRVNYDGHPCLDCGTEVFNRDHLVCRACWTPGERARERDAHRRSVSSSRQSSQRSVPPLDQDWEPSPGPIVVPDSDPEGRRSVGIKRRAEVPSQLLIELDDDE